jgi:thioredoxin 1
MVKQCTTLADLKEALKPDGDKLVVIDFFATWCGPCKVIAPQIETMSGEMADVVFLKVDVDENEDAAQEYNISAMPTFIFVKKEAKVADMMGANADKLKSMIATHK